MKEINGMIAIACMIGLSSLDVLGQTPTENVEGSRKDINLEQRELRVAKIDSAADYEKFKIEAEVKLKENRTSISVLKATKYNDTKGMQVKYNNSVNQLEIKNQQMERKIRESALTSTTRWPSFKREFTNDIEELSKSINDMSMKYPK